MIFVCRDFTTPDVAVDLGTATLRVCTTASDVVTAGSRNAMRGGVIVDRDAAARLLGNALSALRSWHARPPRVLATIPGDADERERETLVSALYRAGAGRVVLLSEPIAAAVGAGLVDDTTSVRMIVDVGEGVTEAAVVSRGVLLHRASIRLACADVRESREPAIETIAAFVARMYQDLDRRISTRVARDGVILTGGGALVRGLRHALAHRLRLDVSVPADPLRAVISGARKLLDGEAAHVWSGFVEA